MNLRPLRSLAWILLVATSGLAGAACSKASSPPAGVTEPPPKATTAVVDAAAQAEVAAPVPTTTELELRDAMRRLWQDHVTWTRVYLISAIADLEDASAALARLLKNQVDLGDAIRPFYGEAAGDGLTKLLREHITVAGEVVAAAKDKDKTKLDEANARWGANADAIAAFLAKANPHWPEADLKMMMRMHLEQTVAEASARLAQDWAGDVKAYDAVVAHIHAMADALSAGIAKQFPDKVAASEATTSKAAELHRAMRALWQDHVSATRVFLMSAIAGLPDSAAASERLLRNQADIGNAIKPYYGIEAGDRLASLLREHITIAAEAVGAAKAGDKPQLADAKSRWIVNADQIAAFLAAANPHWPEGELKMMMRMHLEQTLGEVSARLSRDWVADIAAYDEVVSHILKMADALSDGITKQFPSAPTSGDAGP